jgi:multidrug efflux pump subunit AcrA (membrane-fusion protein)
MNLVGKIFVVLILVMSVVFMAFAMSVYATHRNWREMVMNEQPSVDKPMGLSHRLKDEQTRNKELTEQLDKLNQQLESEKAAKTQAVAKLENELKVSEGELKSLKTAQSELDKAQRDAIAAMTATQANATRDRKEVETQRGSLDDARKDRDAHFKEVTRLTEELNQAVNEKDLLKKRTTELSKDLAKADQLLKKFSLDKSKDYTGVPPVVDGIVTATPGGGVVEISLGADDGLLKGHLLEVYRISGGQSTYVGRIEVVKTAPDRSVCKIDPKFQNSNVMKGDRVASKLN